MVDDIRLVKAYGYKLWDSNDHVQEYRHPTKHHLVRFYAKTKQVYFVKCVQGRFVQRFNEVPFRPGQLAQVLSQH